jgi:hypothetical protein
MKDKNGLHYVKDTTHIRFIRHIPTMMYYRGGRREYTIEASYLILTVYQTMNQVLTAEAFRPGD